MDKIDPYFLWENKWKELENMKPEERLRWELDNECSCNVVEYWWDERNHYGDCPLKNPNADMWIFFESIEEGFLLPKVK